MKPAAEINDITNAETNSSLELHNALQNGGDVMDCKTTRKLFIVCTGNKLLMQ